MRNGLRVSLTSAGRQFAYRVHAVMLELGEAADDLRRGHRANSLSVSMLPSFAARWLLPRLGRFMESHPEISVNVHASLALVYFNRDEVDMAIRFGRGNLPDLEAEKLMDDEYFPVASPKFNRGRLPAHPWELAKFRLIRCDDESWQPWFAAASLKLSEPSGPIFNDSGLVVQAAVDGRGIALVRRRIAEGDLAAGTLVRLFDVAIPAPGSNYLVWPKGKLSPNGSVFREWLLGEEKRMANN